MDNLCDHMIGNVYVKYYHEEDAERALMKLTGRFYSGKLIQAEYTTVSDFREARCRAFHETRCNRGAYCNFMHIKHIPRAIKRRVVREMYDDHPEYLGQTRGGGGKEKKEKKKDKDRERSRSRKKDRKEKDGKDRDRRDRDEGGDKGDAPPARQTSEERRAMIESWNKDKEGGPRSHQSVRGRVAPALAPPLSGEAGDLWREDAIFGGKPERMECRFSLESWIH